MNQNTAVIITTIANLIWGALLLWGFLKSLKPRHNEIAFFVGTAQETLLQAKNYAIHYGFEILNVSITPNLNPRKPNEFTLIVIYKTTK